MDGDGGVRPRVEVGRDRVGATAGRGDQRRALALAEAEVELREGQLGDVVDFGGQLPGYRVGHDLQRLFYDDADFGVLGDHVDRQQVALRVLRRRVGVFALPGDVEGAVDHRFDQRAPDFDFADLRFRETARSRFHGRGFVFGLTAGLEAFGDRRVRGEAFGQGDDGLLQLRLGRPFGVGEAFVVEVDVEAEAGGRGGGVRGRFGVDGRGEGELVTAADRQRITGFVGQPIFDRRRGEPGGRHHRRPRKTFEERVERGGAIGRQGEERRSVRLARGDTGQFRIGVSVEAALDAAPAP